MSVVVLGLSHRSAPILHIPTVRAKEFAGDGHGGDYVLARELFDLDPHDVAAVSVPPETGAVA